MSVAAASDELGEYFQGVARARYAVRKWFRMIDDQARNVGLAPLQHQVLVQARGAGRGVLKVNDVAERLDISPAFASRLVRELEGMGLVARQASVEDRRITHVIVTDEGRALLDRINREVQVHVAYFQHTITDEERIAALTIFGLYVGVPLERDQVEKLILEARGTVVDLLSDEPGCVGPEAQSAR